jgi:two-component system response regulator TtrR
LLERIQAAIAHSRQLLADKTSHDAIMQRYQSLTPREKQIMDMIVAGKANKVMALDMGVTVRTIEVHRHRVMEKMQARSVADLIHAAMQLQAMPGNGLS